MLTSGYMQQGICNCTGACRVAGKCSAGPGIVGTISFSPPPQQLPSVAFSPVSAARAPHICPVCLGKGKLETSHVNISNALAPFSGCPACLGKCVLWEPK